MRNSAMLNTACVQAGYYMLNECGRVLDYSQSQENDSKKRASLSHFSTTSTRTLPTSILAFSTAVLSEITDLIYVLSPQSTRLTIKTTMYI